MFVSISFVGEGASSICFTQQVLSFTQVFLYRFAAGAYVFFIAVEAVRTSRSHVGSGCVNIAVLGLYVD